MALRSCPTTARCAPGGASARSRRWRPHDLDILVLGRQANVRYVTGAPQLWVAGTRPFGADLRASSAPPARSTSTARWDEGIPEEIPHDHLYGLAWNPMTLIEVLKNIDGAATAAPGRNRRACHRRSRQLLPMAFPNAELVDGELAMRAARRIKTADEIRRSARRASASPSTGSPRRWRSSRREPPSRR